MTTEVGSFDDVFGAEYPRLVRALSVADDAADVEDAVQEAFVVAAAVVATRSQPDDVVAGDRTEGTDGSETSGGSDPAEGEIRSTGVEQDGLAVTVEAPGEATAGSRVWFDVTIRNDGDALVHWEAGGCTIPIRAVVGPASTVALGGDGSTSEPPRWDGDAAGLAGWLAEHNVLPTSQWFQPEELTGTRSYGCNSDSRMAELAPGDEVHERGSVELRVPPGELPDGGDYELLVEFQPYPATDPQAGTSPLPAVVARAPITVVDDPGRTPAGPDEAVAAFAGDPELAGWVTSTSDLDTPDLVQDYGTELSWWRGAWELWIDPQWESNDLLRMRYDPAQGEVVDVRTVYLGTAPDDE